MRMSLMRHCMPTPMHEAAGSATTAIMSKIGDGLAPDIPSIAWETTVTDDWTMPKPMPSPVYRNETSIRVAANERNNAQDNSDNAGTIQMHAQSRVCIIAATSGKRMEMMDRTIATTPIANAIHPITPETRLATSSILPYPHPAMTAIARMYIQLLVPISSF